ncbi:MAG: ketopantoate reductase family protein [Burkholderiaceae bacterium]|nr:ketopantoate reductase family protein [Microbacteriaceae bacterium]
MTDPRILVVGAGAVGGFFGGRLAAAGRDVTFLVREGRAGGLARDGLTVRTPHGDSTIQPRTVTAATLPGPFDLVLLSVKSFGLVSAIADVAPAVSTGTLVLPTLNGMRHLDVLRERFGADRVLGGACIVAAQLEPDGAVRQLYGSASLTYGSLGAGSSGDGSASDDRDLTAIDAALRGAGFATRLSPTIELDMWQKWILLAAGGALTCLLRGTVGEIAAAPGGTDTARAIVAECVAVATAAGFAPHADHRAWVEATLTEAGSGFTTSMYRDLLAGAPVEADAIVGDLIIRAEGFGVAVPTLRLAFTALGMYRARI